MGLPYALAAIKGKVLVMNFWTTWCGPCREWEPHFEKVAGRFAGQEKDVLFLEVNCDEDETLVGPYLVEEKPKTSVLFADGLDLLLGVNSFPTTLVLDRTGKIAYRGEGVDMENPEASLVEAIEEDVASHGDGSARGGGGVGNKKRRPPRKCVRGAKCALRKAAAAKARRRRKAAPTRIRRFVWRRGWCLRGFGLCRLGDERSRRLMWLLEGCFGRGLV